MPADGPILEALTHRLSECPDDFLLPPGVGNVGVISVAAIAADHLRAMGIAKPEVLHGKLDAAAFTLISITCWLLHDPWFLACPDLAPAMQKLLGAPLQPLSTVVKPSEFVSDPDRREELVRSVSPNSAFDLRANPPPKDRLTALDSVERVRVVRDTAAAEARAAEVRRMMAKRAAEEAAAKETRE